jgi:hypothetical protein
LVVAGLYGYVSATTWLTELELTTFDALDHYWVDRGWAVEAPIKTQSRIDVPASFARVRPGPAAVAGVAWAQTRGIERVEVQVDDGSWQAATVAGALNDVTAAVASHLGRDPRQPPAARARHRRHRRDPARAARGPDPRRRDRLAHRRGARGRGLTNPWGCSAANRGTTCVVYDVR